MNIPPRADDTPVTTPWAAVRETHSGVVVLLGERAYKFKKPVDLGFLDFTSLEKRAVACRREVELNRRLAPDVYLGVGELHGPEGEVVDPVVVMRRMPEARRLASLVQAGTGSDDEVREVARQLAAFHAAQDPVTEPDTSVTAGSLRALWGTSLTAMGAYRDRLVPGDELDEVESLVRRYLDGREQLFERRRLTGSVVDGHGDLLAEDIFCLDDGPRLLDCLEFDDRLRTVDGVDDAAFLAMDLERLGDRALAARFLGWYAEFSGDEAPQTLVEHYLGYRAFVRAKVACVQHDQGSRGARAEAHALLRQSLSHLRRADVRLVLVGGSPGTGKSTLAGGLADRMGATLLSSEHIRKELAGVPPLSADAPLGRGIYTTEWNRRVHEELMRRAGLLLSLGESVVVDGTWAKQWRRELARRTAQTARADLVELRCSVPEDVAEERLRTRRTATLNVFGSVSDAGVSLARTLRSEFDAWPTATTLDTSGSPAATLEKALRMVQPGVAADAPATAIS